MEIFVFIFFLFLRKKVTCCPCCTFSAKVVAFGHILPFLSMGDPWHGLSGGRSLHNWLIDSAYVGPKDDVRSHGKRKKGRSRKVSDHDMPGLAASHVAPPTFNSLGDTAPAAAPGKRKVRRWRNERLLRDLAGPLDAISIGSLYAPPPWGEKTEATVLEKVTAVDFDYGMITDMSAWEPFRNSVDMDKQDKLLSRAKRSPLPKSAAVTAWQSVDRSARCALRRTAGWSLVRELEDKLIDFQQKLDGELIEQEEIQIPLDTAFERMLLHGLCQFHGFVAFTLHEMAMGDNMSPGCVMAVRKRIPMSGSAEKCEPALRLADILAESREVQSAWA